MPKGHKTKAADWLVLFEGWQQSGLTKKAFCLNRGIPYKSFSRWYNKLISSNMTTVDTANHLPNKTHLFVPVEIKSVEPVKVLDSAKPLILKLNDRFHLHIPVESINSDLLQTVFQSLGVLAC